MMPNSIKSLLTTAALGILAVTAFATAPPKLDPISSSAYYKDLRESYAKVQPGIISWVHDDERKALITMYDEKEPAKFLKAFPGWIAKCPVDSRVHIMAASLLAATKNYEDSIRHRSYFYGLMASILNTGDGKTAGTAYKVISVDEEYAILNFLDAELGKQSLVGQCDVMDVKIDGKPVKIFFDIAIHIEALNRALTPKK